LLLTFAINVYGKAMENISICGIGFAGPSHLMSAESFSRIFLSRERLKFLARPAFIITAFAALLGVARALFIFVDCSS